MQDFQPIPGLAGRIFSGGGGGGSDHRRLRGFPGGGSDPPAPSKCPRCESLNTKFCYYNNYNLSQPRHFCKSCRRYWTKGGVLRNVPVGGGCRKSSSKKPSAAAAKKPAAKERRRPPASRSSSDSSSLTNPNPNPSPSLDLAPIASESGPIAADPIFPELGSFTSLIASAAPAPAILGFGFSDLTPFQLYPKGVEEMRAAGMLNQTVPMEAAGRMNGLDWPAVDSGIFDLTSAVDPGAFWNQGHWCDADPSLYLP